MCCIYANLVEILLNKMSDCCGEHNHKMGHITVLKEDADSAEKF